MGFRDYNGWKITEAYFEKMFLLVKDLLVTKAAAAIFHGRGLLMLSHPRK